MGGVELRQVLADVHNGLVAVDQHDYITVPSGYPVEEHEPYRLVVVGALNGLVMRPVPDGTPGLKTLLLTPIGEHYWRKGNPNRYRAAVSYQVRDGKVQAAAVAR